MARTIEFDVERLLGRLNVLEGTQISYAGSKALERLGFATKVHLGLQMANRFENPVSYTLASPRYDKNITKSDNALELRLFINPDSGKGNAPATYIYPTDAGSADHKAYISRFGRGLSKLGITNKFPVPYVGGTEVVRDKYGNMASSQYRAVLKGLKIQGSSYFALPNGSPGYTNSGGTGSKSLPPGIYKRRGRLAYLLFSLREEVPTVRTAFDFYGISRAYAQQRLPVLLREELRKALR